MCWAALAAVVMAIVLLCTWSYADSIPLLDPLFITTELLRERSNVPGLMTDNLWALLGEIIPDSSFLWLCIVLVEIAVRWKDNVHGVLHIRRPAISHAPDLTTGSTRVSAYEEEIKQLWRSCVALSILRSFG
jgi:hypothetical protein